MGEVIMELVSKTKLLLLGSFIGLFSDRAYSMLLITYAKTNKHVTTQKKSRSSITSLAQQQKIRAASTSDSDAFSLFSSATEKLKCVIAQQARIAFSKNLQAAGVSVSEADTITSSVIDLMRKGYEISQQLTQAIDTAVQRKQELDTIEHKTPEQQQEVLQLQKTIEQLQEKKNNKEKMMGTIASSLALSMGNIGIGSQSAAAIHGLLEQLQIPGLEYGVIASQIAAEIFKGVKKMQEDSYDGKLTEHMGYYYGTYIPSVGGWLFGQHLPSGKVYVRLDAPCHTMNGQVHVEHRELKLKQTYPFKDIREQIVQIMAQEFELGEYQANHLPRSLWSNFF